MQQLRPPPWGRQFTGEDEHGLLPQYSACNHALLHCGMPFAIMHIRLASMIEKINPKKIKIISEVKAK
jgi:hypothetical protein